MSVKQQLSGELQRLAGFSSATPDTVALHAPDQVEISIDFTAVDRMGCSFREVRLYVPSLVDAEFDDLRQWAEDLCSRVTYLLENIGPLELDPNNSQVLIRSTPPDQQSGSTSFYEIMLQSHSDGNFSLRRFRAEKNQPGRDRVDIQVTHEVLHKLVGDLVDTIPGTP